MTESRVKRECPDGGACHHGCAVTECFRVIAAGPLSGVFPDDRWPANVKAAYGDDKVSHAETAAQVVHSPTCGTCNGAIICGDNGEGLCPRCRVVFDQFNVEGTPARALTKAQWAETYGPAPVRR